MAPEGRRGVPGPRRRGDAQGRTAVPRPRRVPQRRAGPRRRPVPGGGRGRVQDGARGELEGRARGAHARGPVWRRLPDGARRPRRGRAISVRLRGSDQRGGDGAARPHNAGCGPPRVRARARGRDGVGEHADRPGRRGPRRRPRAARAAVSPMCTLIGLHRSVPGYDLVIGMNRDEDRLRPAEPPQLLPGPPPLVAPRDRRAGGTWLGVNQAGLFAALSNRRGKAAATARSRGLLMLDVLKAPRGRAMEVALEREVAEHEYNFFNVIAATREELRFFSYDGQLRTT